MSIEQYMRDLINKDREKILEQEKQRNEQLAQHWGIPVKKEDEKKNLQEASCGNKEVMKEEEDEELEMDDMEVSSDEEEEESDEESMGDDEELSEATKKKTGRLKLPLPPGVKILPPIDKDEYPERKGLEGPFRFKSGRILYYDPKQGQYYDARTDIYVDKDELLESAEENPVVKNAEEAAEIINASLSKHFPEDKFYAVAKVTSILGKVMKIDFVNIPAAEAKKGGVAVLNAPVRMSFMMHLTDNKAKPLTSFEEGPFPIVAVIGPDRKMKAEGIKYRVVTGKTPVDSATKFVKWIESKKDLLTKGDLKEDTLAEELELVEEKGGKYGYIAFYKGKQLEVYADTSYQAQQEAARMFKAKKSYEVTVKLAEKDGKPVTHVAEEAEQLDEVSPPDKKIKGWLEKKKVKSAFKDRYGEDKYKQVMYGRAWNLFNKKSEKEDDGNE